MSAPAPICQDAAKCHLLSDALPAPEASSSPSPHPDTPALPQTFSVSRTCSCDCFLPWTPAPQDPYEQHGAEQVLPKSMLKWALLAPVLFPKPELRWKASEGR